MITAYEASFAAMAAEAGVDVILVGDSLGMVVQGESSTKDVTLQQMVYHTKMVRTGAPDIPIIADLPFGTFSSPQRAVESSRALIDAGADGVKFEGADILIARELFQAEIPAMGHLGLLPQSADHFTVQGKDEAAAAEIIKGARELQGSGVFGLVLECIPMELAKKVSDLLSIPTIGIGAGPHCDGQVLVIHDMLGLTEGYLPKFVKPFASFRKTGIDAISAYRKEVKEGTFPDDRHSYH